MNLHSKGNVVPFPAAQNAVFGFGDYPVHVLGAHDEPLLMAARTASSEAVALIQMRDELREERGADLDADVRQLPRGTEDFTGELIRINQSPLIRMMEPSISTFTIEGTLPRTQERAEGGQA